MTGRKTRGLLSHINVRNRSWGIPLHQACIAFMVLTILVFDATTARPEETTEADLSIIGKDSNTPWHISADEIHYEQTTDHYIGMGNVIIAKKQRRLTADIVRFDHRNMKVYALGHVVMTIGRDTLIAGRLEMDLNTETGTAYNGTLFLYENHFYVKGDVIHKTGKDSYATDRGTITACDGDRPAWKLTGRRMKVTIDGYGTAWNTVLWARKTPVFYSPYTVFPAKAKRQSGFLSPQFAVSDRKGYEYDQPYFWAISDSSDATFYEHYMSERGHKIGAEYRYILDEDSKGAVMFDLLDDQKVDDGSSDSNDKWGYEDDSDLRPNSDRYWFRMKHDQSLPNGFLAKLDLDIVSDQDYLNEFEDGYSGFNETEDYFYKTFGRDLDDYDDSTRVNSFNLSKSWSYYSMNAEARWYDDVVARRQEDSDSTLQMLPLVEYSGSKRPFWGTPLYHDLDSEYVYYYRQDGDKGHRIDVHPRVYLPYRFKNFFTFEPSAGIRETAWRTEEEESSSSDPDLKQYRSLYDIKLDLTSDIYQIFEVHSETIGDKLIDRIKHTIRPQIVYDYIPPKDQEDYPDFDSEDRIDRENLVTYSVTNTFTSRAHLKEDESDIGTGDPSEDQPDREPDYTYKQFCRLAFEQSFDIDKSNLGDEEPFSDIETEFELVPFSYLAIKLDSEWSTYDHEFTGHNTAMLLKDTRGDRAYVEHRYDKDSSETFYAYLHLQLTRRLAFYAVRETNILDNEDLSTEIGVFYGSQCWSVDVSMSDEENDRRFEIMINLYGLGGFGTGYDQPKDKNTFWE
jgi:LPS-assembly protein